MRILGWAAGLLAFVALRWVPDSAANWLRCPFKGLSGWPCAACGSGRALRALARFDLGTAFEMSPLFCLLALGGALYAVLDLLRAPPRKGVAARPGPKVRYGLAALAAAVLANWAYLLSVGR